MDPATQAVLNDVMKSLLMLGFFAGLCWLFWPRKRSRSAEVPDGPADEPYRIYTSEHDLVLPARDAPAALADKSPDRGRGWLLHDPAIWREKVAAAREIADHLDPAGEATTRMRSAFVDKASDWAIALLIDQSGSMKDDPILHAAASSRWFSRILGDLGAAVGIFGFSTVGWQGGHARDDWRRSGRPARPGRLCALLHIVYQAFGQSLADEDWEAMLHPDILRENIDGEAIQWVVGLLRERTEPHKLLIVLSDGAPVDDATLLCNGPNYLMRHVRAVIAECEAMPDLILGAVGIDHRVDDWYPNASSTKNPADLPDALVTLITRIVSHSPMDAT